MADIVKTKKELVIVEEYADGHENTLILPNPKDDLTAEQVAAVETLNKNGNVQAGFVGFKSVETRTVTDTNHDIRA